MKNNEGLGGMLLVLWKCRLKKQGRFAATRALGTKAQGG